VIENQYQHSADHGDDQAVDNALTVALLTDRSHIGAPHHCGAPMAPCRPSISDKRRTFARLHESGCFAIPNPFDVGSALYLQSLGFEAIATTSSGFAWTIGHADNRVSREAVLTHLAAIVRPPTFP